MKLPEGKRSLTEEGERSPTEDEMVTLCSEFLNEGTDTTATTLQWIMAELVKHKEIQHKITEEIESVVGKVIGDQGGLAENVVYPGSG